MSNRYNRPAPGADDPDRPYRVAYVEGNAQMDCRFRNEEEGQAWIANMAAIKEEYAAIADEFQFNTAPNNQTIQSRRRIVAWLQMVDNAEALWGFVAESINEQRGVLRRAVLRDPTELMNKTSVKDNKTI